MISSPHGNTKVLANLMPLRVIGPEDEMQSL